MYFNDYYKAKEVAEKCLGFVECEYGDTGYMDGEEVISYCAWNKSGNREDEWEVEAYYTWKVDPKTDRLKPAPLDKERVKELFGVEIWA